MRMLPASFSLVPAVTVLTVLSALAVGCQDGAPWSKDEDKQPAAAAPTTPVEGEGQAAPPLAGVGGEMFPEGDVALSNLPQLVDALNLKPYHARGHRGQGLTIAVLDNGFYGLEQSLGKRLPPDVKVEKAPRVDMQPTTHGTKLAEIVYALATGSTSYSAARPGPTMLLFNTNGFTNFRDAVAQVAARDDIDIVLYAQIWEYGGNADGLGFINREVGAALQRGVLWINAAGNLGQSSFSAPVALAEPGVSSDVALPHQGRYVRLVVPQSGTPVKVVLAWNDFDDSKDYRTPQDLDLILEDEFGLERGASRLVQSGDADTDGPNYSAHAREIIQTVLNPGIYRLRVESRSNNFDANSRLRLTADGVGLRFLDGSDSEDLVLMPADNPGVLTIGAADVKTTSRSRGKPELDVVSEVVFADGVRHTGTSAASAIAAGALAVFTSANGSMNRDGIVAEIQRGSVAVRPARCSDEERATAACTGTPLLRLEDPR